MQRFVEPSETHDRLYRQENSSAEGIRHQHRRGRSARPGRAGFAWWPRYILIRLMPLTSLWHRPRGQAAAGDLASFAEGVRSSTFSIPKTFECGRPKYAASDDVG